MAAYVHTEKDTPEISDPEKVAGTALALNQLLTEL
jgi:hypothetical protein